MPNSTERLFTIASGFYRFLIEDCSPVDGQVMFCFILFFLRVSISWNRLDIMIVILSVVGIVLEEMKSGIFPINPTIIRVMRVLRIARGQRLSFVLSDTCN